MRTKILEGLMGLVDLSHRSIVFKLTDEENELIKEYLQIEDYKVYELKILRNMLVMTLAFEIQEAVNLNEKEKFYTLSSWLTVVTTIIDNAIVKNGGRV